MTDINNITIDRRTIICELTCFAILKVKKRKGKKNKKTIHIEKLNGEELLVSVQDVEAASGGSADVTPPSLRMEQQLQCCDGEHLEPSGCNMEVHLFNLSSTPRSVVVTPDSSAGTDVCVLLSGAFWC